MISDRLFRFVGSAASLAAFGLALEGCAGNHHHRDRIGEEVLMTPGGGVAEVDVDFLPAPHDVRLTYEEYLGPYGQWIDLENYGHCWRPSELPLNWRPYSIGHFVNTDQGWFWMSEGNEVDWGAVTYHYGSWYEDSLVGW